MPDFGQWLVDVTIWTAVWGVGGWILVRIFDIPDAAEKTKHRRVH